MKKGAIGIGLLILIALFLFPGCPRKKTEPKAAPSPVAFETDAFAITLPPGWKCSEELPLPCHVWKCDGPGAKLQFDVRPVTESESLMDGNYVEFDTQNACWIDGVPARGHEVSVAQLGGTDWKHLKLEHEHLYFKRTGKSVTGVAANGELTPELKSALDSLHIK